MKSASATAPPCTPPLLAGIFRTRLRRIQHQPGLINGLLGQTGLSLELKPP